MTKSHHLNTSFQDRANTSINSVDLDSVTLPKEKFTYKPQNKKYNLQKLNMSVTHHSAQSLDSRAATNAFLSNKNIERNVYDMSLVN